MGTMTGDDRGAARPLAGEQDVDGSWPHDPKAPLGPGATGWHDVAPQPPVRPRRRRGRVLAAAMAAGALVAGVVSLAGRSTAADSVAPLAPPPAAPAASAQQSSDPQIEHTQPPPTHPPQAGSASAALQTLPVKGRAPKTGYNRDAWAVWSDYDGNGCDERQDTLVRDLTDVQRAGCQVVGGRLVDPYTGTVITVPTADPQIDIDHVVSLSDAWQKGAAGWPGEQLQRFASDPLNLLAVSSSANRSKSDADAATWLPANKAYRCEMVARQIAVKTEYGLWVTRAEHDAMAQVLTSCPDQQLPQRGAAPAQVQQGESFPTQPSAGFEAAPGLDPQFSSCKALHAAGYKGGYVNGVDPEYDWYRDGDGDGVVCE